MRGGLMLLGFAAWTGGMALAPNGFLGTLICLAGLVGLALLWDQLKD